MKQHMRALLGLWLLVVTVLALWPFDISGQCAACRNGAALDAQSGALVFPARGLVRMALPETAHDTLVEQGALQISLQVTTTEAVQTGPARLVSYSRDPYQRNFTIAQDGSALVFRLRTDRRDLNGMAAEMRVPDVFVAGQGTHILVTSVARETVIAVNGEDRARIEGRDIDFAAWNDRFGLYLGNEATGNRPWLGRIEDVVIRAGAEGPVLAELRRDGDALTLPDWFWGVNFVSMLRETNAEWRDFVLHIGMFLPIGFGAGLLIARDRHPWRASLMLLGGCAAFALTIEFLQEFLISRSASWVDLLFGVFGAAVGLGAAYIWRRPAHML